MARTLPSGTPDRPHAYLRPRSRRSLLFAALAVPLVLLAVTAGVYRAGYTTIASPGPTSLRHAPIEGTCVECHQSAFPHTVVNLRCERCHDPRVTGRLEIAAHATWTPVSQHVAGTAETVSCASCHTDHRGRLASLRAIEPAECAQCHAFKGLTKHPEFALITAGTAPSRGLQFSHAVHLDEARRTLGRGCEACHRSTSDLSGFEPTSFDRQCAVCHVKNGVLPVITDPVAEALVTPPALGGAAEAIGGISVRRPGRDRIVVSGLSHRDPWILQNLRLLNRGLSNDADVAERMALEARLAALELARSGALSSASTSDLQRRVAEAASTPDDGHGGRRRERLELELQRRLSGGAAPASLAAMLSEERVLESTIAATQARLSLLKDRLSVSTLSGADAERRRDAIQALVGPCLTCHVLRDGREFAPVTVDAKRLDGARFTHTAHVTQIACEKCHEAIAQSAKATDLNTPGIATCRQCHSTGQAPSGCMVCHQYHPSPDVGFGRAGFARN